MERKLIISEARTSDAGHMAMLDAYFYDDDVMAKVYAQRRQYWRERIDRQPGPIYVAKIEGIRTVGYMALGSVPVEGTPLEIKYAIGNNCEDVNVKQSLLERAGLVILPINGESEPEEA